MPTAPHARCTVPGCGRIATWHGRCDQHQRKAWEQPSQHTRMIRRQDQQKFHDATLRRSPICQWPGCTQPATDADHIVPVSQGGALHDINNAQALCHMHHTLKTRQEATQRRTRRPHG